MLPLELCRLIAMIGKQEQHSPRQVLDGIRIFAWYWHSRRIDHPHGLVYGEIALTAIATLLGLKSSKEPSQILGRLMEGHSLLTCRAHQSGHEHDRSRISRYSPDCRLLRKRADDLVLLPCFGQREANKQQAAGEDHRPAHIICAGFGGDPATLDERIKPLLERDSDYYEGGATVTFIRRRKASLNRTEGCPPPWRVACSLSTRLDLENEILARNAQDLHLNPEVLAQASSSSWSAYDRALLRELEEKGLCPSYQETRSGRLRSADKTCGLTNSLHLGRQGSSLWSAIAETLWRVDLRAADFLAMAVLSGDLAMMEAWAGGDVYQELAALLDLDAPPGEARALAKSLTLATLYGAGTAGLVQVAEDRGFTLQAKVAEGFRKQFAERFPDWRRWRRLAVRAGYQCSNGGRRLRLPHGGHLCLEFNQGYACPAHVGQSVVRLIIAQLVVELDQRPEGFRPVFEIHDCAVTCVEPQLELVNALLRRILMRTADEVVPRVDHAARPTDEDRVSPGGTWSEGYAPESSLLWGIGADATFVTTKPISFTGPWCTRQMPPTRTAGATVVQLLPAEQEAAAT